MQTDSEHVQVKKIVDLVPGIPKHLDLYFADFLRTFTQFQNLLFSFLKCMYIFRSDPWNSSFYLRKGP